MHAPVRHDRRIHPGSGRRRGPDHPKGRQVDPAALAEVAALLGDRERRRDLLIEHLHLLQDHFGCLYARHLAALAEEMRLALVEVYEVASFYAHFDIVMDGEAPPPPLTVRVCDSLSCELAGATQLLADLRSATRTPTSGSSEHPAWAAVIARRSWRSAMRCTSTPPQTVSPKPSPQARRTRRFRNIPASMPIARPAAIVFSELAWPGERKPEELIEILEHSGLRGLGGAGFPTGRKWRLVLQEPAPRLLAVNADEGEPGTFKDRYFLETDPHRMLEGMLIAAWVVEAAEIYIYLRDEYPQCRAILESEIAAVEAAGLARHAAHPPAPRRRRLYLRRGIGDAREHRGQARPAAAASRPFRRRSGSSAGRP